VLRTLWSAFNDLISFTANIWQNIDGLVFTALGVYLLIRLGKSVLGRDESTVKASTAFDYLGFFPRESDHKIYRLEEVWKLPFHEKTVHACFQQATEEHPFLCIPNRGVWIALHDFFSGIRNEAVPRATDLGEDKKLRRVSHVLGITFGDYETRQARIEDLPAPKMLDILRDPLREFQKAALSSREVETARQLTLIELASLVCWKAPHLLADALMEPELSHETLMRAPGRNPLEKKLNLEQALEARHHQEFKVLLARGRDLGKLMLLTRPASYEWLNSIKPSEENTLGEIPPLTPDEHSALARNLKEREAFKPWTHRLVETISKLPYVRKRFPHDEYVQKVGRLESDGWFIRVYVNHQQ